MFLTTKICLHATRDLQPGEHVWSSGIVQELGSLDREFEPR